MQQPPNPHSQYPQQQWQQPSQPLPPQQWQQQPDYTQPQSYQQQPTRPPQPPLQRQPPSRNSWPWWISLIIFGVIFISYLLSKSGIQSTSTPSTSMTAPTVNATTASTSAVTTPTMSTVGEHVTSGVWVITVNSAKTNTGDEFDTPQSGNIYLLINFTAKNTDTNNHDMSPNYFTLRDNQGNTYDLAYITVPSDPRGAVVAGQQLRGDLSYEVPKSLHSFVLQFDPPTDSDDSQIVQWTIQVQS